MSGKIYVGSSNGVVTRASDIFIGDSNDVARHAKGVFVGNSSDKAVKIWPASVLPIGYQEVEWLEVPSYYKDIAVYDNTDYMLNTFIKTQDFPRLDISFSFTKNIPNDQICGIVTGISHSDTNKEPITQSAYIFGFSKNRFVLIFGIGSRRSTGGYDAPDVILSTDAETILTNTTYTLVFNKIENNISNFYLYNTDGYYSIPRNNLLGSSSKNIVPEGTIPWYDGYRQYIHVLGYDYLGVEFFTEPPYSTYFQEYGGSDKYYTRFSPPEGFRFYYCKMYDKNENLIRDLVPCYRKSDNVVGLYDVIDRIFIVGDVQLTPGPNV